MRTLLNAFAICGLLPFQAMAAGAAEEEVAAHKILCEGIIPPGPIKPLVHAEIGGKDHTFIFDTGSKYPLMIDKEIGPSLGAVVRKIGSVEHVQGSYALPETTIGALSLPAAERPGVEIDMLKKAFGICLDGIIGWPALAGNTLFLDHDNKRFEIIRGDWKLSPDATSIPITDEGGHPYLQWKIGDSAMKFIIDTGSDSGFALRDEDYDALLSQGFISSAGGSGKALNTNGLYSIKKGSFLKGNMMGVDLKGFPVNSNPRSDNLLGELFLLKFNITISSSALWLDYQARRNPEAPVSTDLMLGIIFTYQDDGPTVLRLKGGASGQVAGLETGDVVSSITEIGDRPINANTLNELCREKAGQTIHLKIRRNGSTLEKEMKLPAAISAWN